MGELSAWHWIVVIGVFVVLFGAKRLPDAARSLGRSTRILKAELRAEEPAASAADTGTAAPSASPGAAATGPPHTHATPSHTTPSHTTPSQTAEGQVAAAEAPHTT